VVIPTGFEPVLQP